MVSVALADRFHISICNIKCSLLADSRRRRDSRSSETCVSSLILPQLVFASDAFMSNNTIVEVAVRKILNIIFNAAAGECDQRRGKIVYKLKCDDETRKPQKNASTVNE